MAIDALGGVTAYQAQPVVKAQTNIPQPATMEGQSMEATPTVDATTIAVAKVSEQSDFREETQNQQPSNEQIRKAVEEINKKANSSDVQFGVHEGTNRITIKIVDRETKKVIKELPPEKTLDMIAKAWELAGLLVDEKR